ncbi:hypothetical protein VFPBJ_10723 [Purpureocillium lilacinum]|uniref:Wnt and FGF inhibitory regulator domain-containing protein n=1 Tax=Purpureocillium lilacinum TaxID=33203 RepID=A0A179FVT6_PURLI|nr:hypothetical protein Purlil1_9810 [Purpureocillium lilacinum]OAQ69348.1 hypothetical protein VFPBJ_10723 [Purpureocillium lilacinum]
MASHQPQHEGGPNHDRDANAPEVMQLSSPATNVPSLEREWQSQYQQTRAAEHPPLPTGDTAKEAVINTDDKYVVPMEVKAEYPETATATATSPQMSVPWTPDSEHMQHVNSDVISPNTPHEARGVAPDPPPPGSDAEKEEPKAKGKILGMSRKAFLILIVVLIIIIAAAVGGGVGGAVASSNKSKSDAATTSSSSSAVPSSTPTPSTTSSSATATSTSEPLPTLLTNQTWPAGPIHAFQGFSRNNYTGQPTKVVTTEGGTDFSFDIHSYIWIPNINNCCVNFCANSTKQGYIGYRCPATNQTDASESVARVFIWCQDSRSDKIAKDKGCS